MTAYVNGQGTGWLGAFALGFGIVGAAIVVGPIVAALARRLFVRRTAR